MKLTLKDCLKICGSVFVLYLCIHYWQTAVDFVRLVLGSAVPMFAGCAIAYVVNILMSFYEKHFCPGKAGAVGKLRRPVCMMGAFVTLVAVVLLVIWLIVPQLSSCVRLIAAELPGFISEALDLVDEWNLMSDEVLASLESIEWKAVLGQLFDVVKSGIGSVMDVVVSTVSSVFSGVVTALVALIFSIYLLSGKEKLGRQSRLVAKRYLKDSWYKKICYLLRVVNDCFHGYIVGQCIEAVILGTLCAIGMAILRLPYATMIGALVAFTALIPVAGAYIGAAVGAFMILTVDPWKAVIFLIFLVILQQFEGNVIYPRVVGSSLGLPGIWVLAAVTVGGGIMGITGMLLGVPMAAALYRILREDVNGAAKTVTREMPPAEKAAADVSAESVPEIKTES